MKHLVVLFAGLFIFGNSYACECDRTSIPSIQPEDLVFKIAKDHLTQLGFKFTKTGPLDDIDAKDRDSKLMMYPAYFYRTSDDRRFSERTISGGNCTYTAPQGEIMYTCARSVKRDYIVPYGLCSMKIQVEIDHTSSSGKVISSSCDKLDQYYRDKGDN